MPDHKKATHGTPAGVKKHKDHDLITKRMNDYIEVYKTKNTDALMEFYAKDDGFQYSDFSSGREAMDLKEIKAVLDTTFNSFYDLDIKTLSLHGHKDFTAWEWEITCKRGLDEKGEKIAYEDAPPAKLIGVTLMWWNEDNLIVKNHDYSKIETP